MPSSLESIPDSPSLGLRYPGSLAEMSPFDRGENQDRRVPHLRITSDRGEPLTCPHPEILALDNSDAYSEHELVTVRLNDNMPSLVIPFGTYIGALGVAYDRYESAVVAQQRSGPVNQRALLQSLHQDVLNYRAQTVLRLKGSYESHRPDRDNRQEITALEDGKFFLSLMNDLQIEGFQAQAAGRREDFLDGIDEFLVFNEGTLYGDDAPNDAGELRIGIQRSYTDKRGEVRRDHWRFIPEHSDLLSIPRIALWEEGADYGHPDGRRGTGY